MKMISQWPAVLTILSAEITSTKSCWGWGKGIMSTFPLTSWVHNSQPLSSSKSKQIWDPLRSHTILDDNSLQIRLSLFCVCYGSTHSVNLSGHMLITVIKVIRVSNELVHCLNYKRKSNRVNFILKVIFILNRLIRWDSVYILCILLLILTINCLNNAVNYRSHKKRMEWILHRWEFISIIKDYTPLNSGAVES